MENNFGEKIKFPKINQHLLKLIEESLSINNFYLNHFKEIDNLYFITNDDIKLIKFIFNYFFNFIKYKDFQKNLKNYPKNNNENISYHKIIKSNRLMVKFINFCILNSSKLSEYIYDNKENLNQNIYILIKNFFLNEIISVDDMNVILILKLIICLYDENNNIQNYKNNNIKKEKELYSLINFLLSFIKDNMNNYHINKFNKIIEFIYIIIIHIIFYKR